jgi:hypothetical protein
MICIVDVANIVEADDRRLLPYWQHLQYKSRQDYTLEITVQSLVYLSYLWLATHPTLALQGQKAT